MLLKTLLGNWPMQSRWLYLRRIKPNLVNLVWEHLGESLGAYPEGHLLIDEFGPRGLIHLTRFNLNPCPPCCCLNSTKTASNLLLEWLSGFVLMSLHMHTPLWELAATTVGRVRCQGSSPMRQRRWMESQRTEVPSSIQRLQTWRKPDAAQMKMFHR